MAATSSPGVHPLGPAATSATARDQNSTAQGRPPDTGRTVVAVISDELATGDGAPDPAEHKLHALPGALDADGEQIEFSGLDDGIAIPPDDAAVVRRVKALATTRPLHDLDRSKAMWDDDIAWDRYDLLTLALTTVDVVALTQSLATGMLRPDVVAYCAAQAARQNREASEDERLRVARRVVDALVSDQTLHVAYADHLGPAQADGPIRREWPFRILSEKYRSDGVTIDVRATMAAINVLLDGLDLDIESSQVAAEAQMRNLIERGALTSAVAVAQRSRLLTVFYIENIAGIVRDTIIDAKSHDWDTDVPKLLSNALAHVHDRIEAESALLEAIEGRRADARDAAMRREANSLISLLSICRRRHSELQRYLLGARTQLRRAHDERYARPHTRFRQLDLERDLLIGLLSAPSGEVAVWADLVISRVSGISRRWWTSGGVLVDELLSRPSEPSPGDEVPSPEFEDTGAGRWWEPYWELADTLVKGIRTQTRFSELLAQLRSTLADDDELDELTAVAALCHVAHEHFGESLKTGDGPRELVIAIATGDALDDTVVDGEDLLLVRASLDDKTAGVAAISFHPPAGP
jgi:hypothetical protein